MIKKEIRLKRDVEYKCQNVHVVEIEVEMLELRENERRYNNKS
jgi:hypothetical protein